MFGEKPIVGQTIIRVKKDRIKLPSFTFVESGDEIAATLDIFQKKVILLQKKEFMERLETLNKKIKLAHQEGRLSYTTCIDLQRRFFGILPLHDRIINQRLEYQLFNRRSEASLELSQLQRLYLRDEIFAVGVGNTLELYPSEQDFHEYQKMEEERKLLKQPK